MSILDAILLGPLRTGQKSPVFEMVINVKPDHSKTRPFNSRPLKSLVFTCFQCLKGRISDPLCIQIPTVYFFSLNVPNSFSVILIGGLLDTW